MTSSPKAAHLARARAAARLAAVQALYQRSMEDVAIRPLLREFHHHRLGSEIEGVDYAEADADLFDAIVSGVDERQAELDALIAARLSKGWSLPRLDRPLAAILRAGAWELAHRPNATRATIIAAYLDIADAFYDKTEKGFANALLDAVANDVRPDGAELG